MATLESRVAHLEGNKSLVDIASVTPTLFAAGMRRLGFSAPTPITGETVAGYIRRVPHSELLDFVRVCNGYA